MFFDSTTTTTMIFLLLYHSKYIVFFSIFQNRFEWMDGKFAFPLAILFSVKIDFNVVCLLLCHISRGFYQCARPSTILLSSTSSYTSTNNTWKQLIVLLTIFILNNTQSCVYRELCLLRKIKKKIFLTFAFASSFQLLCRVTNFLILS